jgi:hypothetical protein
VVFENGQKKMSKIEKSKKVLKNSVFFKVSDVDAHKIKKSWFFSVMITFCHFLDKSFSVAILGVNGNKNYAKKLNELLLFKL